MQEKDGGQRESGMVSVLVWVQTRSVISNCHRRCRKRTAISNLGVQPHTLSRTQNTHTSCSANHFLAPSRMHATCNCTAQMRVGERFLHTLALLTGHLLFASHTHLGKSHFCFLAELPSIAERLKSLSTITASIRYRTGSNGRPCDVLVYMMMGSSFAILSSSLL